MKKWVLSSVVLLYLFIVKLEFTLRHFFHLLFIAFSDVTLCPAYSTHPVSTSAFITAIVLVFKCSGLQLWLDG